MGLMSISRRGFLGLTSCAAFGVILPGVDRRQLAAAMVRPKRCPGLDYRPRLTQKRMVDLFFRGHSHRNRLLRTKTGLITGGPFRNPPVE